MPDRNPVLDFPIIQPTPIFEIEVLKLCSFMGIDSEVFVAAAANLEDADRLQIIENLGAFCIEKGLVPPDCVKDIYKQPK